MLIEAVLPPPRPRRRDGRGRPRVPDRKVMGGIVYRLRTGCQWKAIPERFGSGSTCHRRMQEWNRKGVFGAIFQMLVQVYDDLKGLDLRWASMDAALVKAPKGGS